MKKFTLLLMAVLAFVAPVKAQDAQNSVLTYQWAHTLEGAANASNNVLEAKKAADGSYLVANKVGTKTGVLTAKFDGAVIEGFEGGTYGTSGAGNLYLQKVKADGTVAWAVRSAKADVSTASIAPTSDGGAVLVIKSRVENLDGEVAKVLTLIDAAGNTVEVSDAETIVKTYYVTIAKVDKDGKLEWARLVSGVKANKAADVLTVAGCAVDADDNIYVAGKLAGTANFQNAEKVAVGVTSQNTTGDLVIVKFDKDGYLLSSLLPTNATSASSQVDAIALNGGTLYLAGQVKGNGLQLDGKDVTGHAKLSALFLASINMADLSVNYVKAFTPELNANADEAKKTFVIQNKALNYVSGNLYLTGSLNGGLTADDITVNTNSTFLKGCVVKAQATDGKLLAVGINDQNAAGITGHFGVYEGANTVYTLGYDLKATSSAILFTYDKNTLSKQAEIKFSNISNGAVCAPMLVDGNKLLLMTRGKAGKGLTFEGTSATMEGFSDWGVLYCLYSISDVPTGIKNISSVGNASDRVNVYTVSGVCVKQNVSVSEAIQGLAKGVYVVGGKKVIVK